MGSSRERKSSTSFLRRTMRMATAWTPTRAWRWPCTIASSSRARSATGACSIL
eukprot:jgi/Mesen1/7238/ME000373S06305